MLGLEQLRSIGGGIVVGQGYMTVHYDALAEFVRNNPPYWGHFLDDCNMDMKFNKPW